MSLVPARRFAAISQPLISTPPPAMGSTPQEEMAWLKNLQKSLWKESSTFDRYRTPLENRRLTREEYRRGVEIIRDQKLLCVMGVGVFGFGFSLTVYRVVHDEIYPGVGSEVECLVTVTNKHLPVKLNAYEQSYIKDVGWKLFSKLTHTEENKKRLREYGLPEQKDKSYYEY